MHDPRDLLVQCFRAAVSRANPAAATERAVSALDAVALDPAALDPAALDPAALVAPRAWILALGKGAAAMARGAAAGLTARGVPVAGGLVVSVVAETVPPPLRSVAGDHPTPGPHSADAAASLAEMVGRIPASETVFVLLSGGTTSLVAAPVDGVSPEDVRSLFASLLGSGADIATMNALRKRVLRWGGGRLARALTPRRVRCLIMSDVIGNDVGAIGSGPCAPDPLTAAELLAMVRERGLDDTVPLGVRAYLRRVQAGDDAETPKPGDPVFAHVLVEVLLDVHTATTAAAAEARAAGVPTVVVAERPLSGAAAAAGEAIAIEAVRFRESLLPEALGAGPRAALVWGGETTVRLPSHCAGTGGRCQELALSAASALHRMGARAHGVTILAAGTDGRDGPTDAAGAIVDERTWAAIARNGADPAAALARHDAYPALDAAGALLRTGPTGTNVNDLVIALVNAPPPPALLPPGS